MGCKAMQTIGPSRRRWRQRLECFGFLRRRRGSSYQTKAGQGHRLRGDRS